MELDVVHRFDQGELVVILDDQPGPQPALLAAAAAVVVPDVMAELVRYSSGFLSVALPTVRCDELGLPCLAHDPFSGQRAVPAVSVDARLGVSTGISATDRCTTARVLADPDSIASDLCRPGHVVAMRVPMAAPRGADARSRQIFAAMDLCAWTERSPAVVTSVVVGETGDTVSNADAIDFAAAQGYAVVRASTIPSTAVERRATDGSASRSGSGTMPAAIDILACSASRGRSRAR